jgi:hypothetical protein
MSKPSTPSLSKAPSYLLTTSIPLTAHATPLKSGISPPGKAAAQAQLAETYGKLPLHFEANRGQTDSQVKFLARGPG